MMNNPVYQAWLDHMSAPHSDIDALASHYISRHLTWRILAKNYELHTKLASHEPLDEFDLYVACMAGERERSKIYPPIRSRK